MYLDQSSILTHVQHLALQKLHDSINKEPDSVKACRLFEQFEAATQDTTTHVYTTIINTLNKTMTEPQKDTPAIQQLRSQGKGKATDQQGHQTKNETRSK